MLSKKEKRIKKINGLENLMYSVRCRVLIWLRLFPRYKLGIWRIRWKQLWGETNGLCCGDFTPQQSIWWGSARPDTANVNNADAVFMKGKRIYLKSFLRDSVGFGFFGGEQHRKIVSGVVSTKPQFEPKGIYFATLEFHPEAIGSWDSWWFMRVKKDDPTYYEYDGMERFFGSMENSNDLTTSVHKGISSQEGRELYNNSYKIPKKMYKINMTMEFGRKGVMRTRVNGMLVFVGRQWPMKAPMSMIVGTGIFADREGVAINMLKKLGHYSFVVSDIKHIVKSKHKAMSTFKGLFRLLFSWIGLVSILLGVGTFFIVGYIHGVLWSAQSWAGAIAVFGLAFIILGFIHGKKKV